MMGRYSLQREIRNVYEEEVKGEREGRKRKGQPVEEKTDLTRGERSRKQLVIVVVGNAEEEERGSLKSYEEEFRLSVEAKDLLVFVEGTGKRKKSVGKVETSGVKEGTEGKETKTCLCKIPRTEAEGESWNHPSKEGLARRGKEIEWTRQG